MPATRNNDHSPPTYTSTTTNSVRRNLFTHLARRPTSSQSQPQTQSQSHSTLQPHSSASGQTQASSQPQMQRIPSLPHSPRMKDLTGASASSNFYNSDLPNPFSPAAAPTTATTTASLATTASVFPPNAIVALHPVTGRPLLPTLPSVPAHLHLSSSDSSSDPAHHHHLDGDDDGAATAAAGEYTHSSSYWAAAMEDAEREDKERIEKSLVEMMYRQRKRGQSRGRTAGRGKERDLLLDDLHHGDADDKEEVGRMESEELMGLVMASLRKKVAVLDEERWMFEAGAGGAGVSFGEAVEMSSNRYN